MNEIEKRIINKIDDQKTIFLHGEWGIGKTYFAKNQLYESLSEKGDVLYIDSRIFDQDTNAFDYVALFAKENKARKAKFKNAGKVGSKVLLNTMIVGANNLLKTNIKTMKVTSEVDLEIELAETKRKITLVIDELDRITPDTILRTLNFINGISIMNDSLQIITIGNRDEIQSILKTRFGYSDKRDFLHKYFEDEYSLDEISNEYIKEIGGTVFSAINIMEAMKIHSTPREITRTINLYARLAEKYRGIFSNGVWYTAFYAELMDGNLMFNRTQLWSGDDIDIRATFQFFDKGVWKNINLSNTYGGHGWVSPLVDLNTNFGLSKFGDWVEKWKFISTK